MELRELFKNCEYLLGYVGTYFEVYRAEEAISLYLSGRLSQISTYKIHFEYT